MKTIRRALFTTMVFCVLTYAQAGPDTSSISVENVSFQTRTINVLGILAKRYRVVIGVQGTLVGNDSKEISVSVSSGTLRDVFDAIVSQDTRFEWHQSSNGAIHFVLRGSPLTLADVKVPSLDVENPRRTEVVEILGHITQVRDWLHGHACDMAELMAGPPPEKWRGFSVHLKDVPLSFVLDDIAGGSQTYFWSAIQYSTQPCAINLSLS